MLSLSDEFGPTMVLTPNRDFQVCFVVAQRKTWQCSNLVDYFTWNLLQESPRPQTLDQKDKNMPDHAANLLL
jgi:hypothetical protein